MHAASPSLLQSRLTDRAVAAHWQIPCIAGKERVDLLLTNLHSHAAAVAVQLNLQRTRPRARVTEEEVHQEAVPLLRTP